MKKRFGVMVRTFKVLSIISGALLIATGGAVLFAADNGIVIAAADAGIGAAILLITLWMGRRRKGKISEFIGEVQKEYAVSTENIAESYPLPMAAMHIDGSIVWYNKLFSAMLAKRSIKGEFVDKLLPLKWSEILKSKDGINFDIQYEGKFYAVTGTIFHDEKTEETAEEDNYVVYLYFINKTAEQQIRKKYIDEKTVVALISIDNYEDLLQKLDDSENQRILFAINKLINEWVREASGVLKKTDRDRYFIVFENYHLEEYIAKKFDLLEHVRRVGEEEKVPVTISIGIGVGKSVLENESFARNALEMALGRGGDQAVIKDETQYRFYGGKSKEYEKSTRVKTRAVATAMKDFIQHADCVIFMGHKGADYDCFGAAMGLQRAVRTLKKRAYIVDEKSPAVQPIYNEVRKNREYDDILITAEEALDIITKDSLLVILDTHRPSMLPCIELLHHASKIMLIDHHRRSTEFISPCSLVYHEPYASSTCEMATELLQYIDEKIRLSPLESECLYTGILMDTKNFLVKTGVRTFEAASYLRRSGLDTVMVKKMFSVSKTDYDRRAEVVKTADKITDKIAVAVSWDWYPNVRVIASQAADEMLNIENVEASFVVYPLENAVGISGRSFGNINVQLILESLGGGGHMTGAGAQLSNCSIMQARTMLVDAILSYDKENKEE